MKYVVVNADDLGICEATNRAIGQAHREGLVTSASLMANGPAYDDAVESVVRPHPGLGIGLHVCLTSGRSLLPAARLPDLVDSQGRFRHGFLSLCRLLTGRNGAVQGQVEAELTAQFERVLAAGVPVDHVDGHRHIHMIPTLFLMISQLAERYGCGVLRVSYEPLRPLPRLLRPWRLMRLTRNYPKQFLLSQLARLNRRVSGAGMRRHVFGILDSGHVDRGTLVRLLSGASEGVTEIITHPGCEHPAVDAALSPGDRRFLQAPQRIEELQALLDPELHRWAERKRLSLVRYADIQGTAENGTARGGGGAKAAVVAVENG